MLKDLDILVQAILKILWIWSPAWITFMAAVIYVKTCEIKAKKKRAEIGVFINTYRGKERA